MAIIFNFTTGHSIFLCAEYRHLISSDYETYRILFVLYAVFLFFFRLSPVLVKDLPHLPELVLGIPVHIIPGIQRLDIIIYEKGEQHGSQDYNT